METDAEMVDLTIDSTPTSPATNKPSSRHVGDDNNGKGASSPILGDSSNTSTSSHIPDISSKKVPASKNPAKQKVDKPASTAKPKSTKPPRSPSPSPPPPLARPPLQTIRLDIKLGGPDNYEVNLAELARNTGQRAPTPVPVKRDSSDSEGEGDGEDEKEQSKDKPKDKDTKKRKKNVAVEYYDTTDPFIDDSELPMDERTFFAQTKQQGFYVSSGEVALLKDKTPKKPKSKKISLAGPSAKISAANGSTISRHDRSRDSPAPVTSDDEKKRKSSEEHGDSSKKRKTNEVHTFHPELEAELERLKAEIAKESWETKGKFPPSLKPILGQVSLKAVVLGEYDDNFFSIMPKLFPYNKFTMTKLIKRTIWKEHMVILTDRQTELLDELAVITKEGFAKAQEEWEKSVTAWEKKQEKAKAAEADGGSASGDASVSISAAPMLSAIDDAAASGTEQDHAPKISTKESQPPAKKYRMTEPIKAIIWQLVLLSNECCRIENEKNQLEGSTQTVSEQGVRKVLYQKILHAFPEGWISSGQISREVSSLKKRFEKESLAEGD